MEFVHPQKHVGAVKNWGFTRCWGEAEETGERREEERGEGEMGSSENSFKSPTEGKLYL